ncbi:hypothetical protein [Bernardetia sp.]|uniref:hypothetical protein n=1 Tax=Bernardetia sp. TaxID=1937974 RepID=UPI0025BF272F|nr:hypothetical protein [Bernardetia sp.]
MRKGIVLIIFVFTALGCERRIEESVETESKILENGKHLKVEKTNRETTSIRLITKHNYGTTHSFKYKLYLTDDEIEWKGTKSQEPKKIAYCNKTIYLRGIEKNYKQIQTIDSVTNDTLYNSYYEMEEFFLESIDKRYFFKNFGTQKWVNISDSAYKSVIKDCKEYEIPNDNELKL